ncbi:MAG: translation initiation factor IF-2 subunit beta [Candidatus Pacearchaeota archaeon]
MEYENLLEDAYNKISKKEKICDRFEVRKPNIIYEGKKTIITNFTEISSCLRRNQEHLARFLYKNLASFGEIAGERLILARKIAKEMVQQKILLYIEQFVKCKNCGKPDTELVEEKGEMFLKCLACGNKYLVNKF